MARFPGHPCRFPLDRGPWVPYYQAMPAATTSTVRDQVLLALGHAHALAHMNMGLGEYSMGHAMVTGVTLASRIGVPVAQVTRELNKLAKAGLIEKGGTSSGCVWSL